MHDLEARVARLERENWWIKRLGTLAGLAAAVILLQGQAGGAKVPERIEAQEFRVVDAQGRLRAKLSADRSGSALRLLDASDTIKASLEVSNAHGPSLALSDEHGNLGAYLAALPTVGSALRLLDAGKIRVGLLGRAAWAGGVGPGLQIFDANDKGRAELRVTAEGPALRLTDARERSRATLGVTPLKDMGTGVTGWRPESSLVLFGPDGVVTWKAP